MKKWKRIGLVLLICLIGVGVLLADNLLNRAPAYDPAAFEGYRGKAYTPEAGHTAISAEDTFQVIGENAGVQLLFNGAQNTFSVQSRQGTARWDSFAAQEDLDKQPPSALFSAVIADAVTGNTLTVDPVKDSCTVVHTSLKNGVELELFFSQYQFGITLQVFLDEDGMICRIPLEGIREDGGYHLVNVDVLPFFGAAKSGEEGYVLFPDGAGALYRFGGGAVRTTTPLTTDIYTSRSMDLDAWEDNATKGIRSCMMPVYGMKRGDSAFVAYVCEGDASAAITLAPNGYVYPLDRVYSCSVYRRVTAMESESGFDVFQVEEESRGNNYAVKFFFGEGETADYSWMAQAIRDHLVDSGLLPEKAQQPDSAYIELLMGVGKSELFGSRYLTMTTADQAQGILQDLTQAGGPLTASLLGWQKEGYGVSPGSLNAAGQIGGKKGIANLSASGSLVALDLPVVYGNTEKTGSKRRRDAIVNIRDVTVIDQEETRFVLNANTQYQLLSKLLKKFDSYNGKGILLSGAAELIYEDYNQDSAMTRQEVQQVLQALMDLAGDQGPLLLRQANAYALPYADFLVGMPESASGYAILSESIPFYYLVVNGNIPYALDTAGNLSSDLQKTKLKWLEYGAVPYFLFSEENSEELIDTAAEHLFSTRYADQKEQAADVLQEISAVYEQLAGQRMCGHEQVMKDVYISHYSGGGQILINYTESAVQIDGITVEARGYQVRL